MAWLIAGILVVVVVLTGYLGLVTWGAAGRSGPRVASPPAWPAGDCHCRSPELVFDLIAASYLGRQPKAVVEKIRVLERGADMVLAAHRTPIHKGRLMATTVETVRFSRPDRVDFRLVRGPVPHVVERFAMTTMEHGWSTTASSAPTGGHSAPGGAGCRPCLGADRRSVTGNDRD